MELKAWGDKRYQIAADSIRCAADREGCEVFEIHGDIGRLLILANDEKEARKTYQQQSLLS